MSFWERSPRELRCGKCADPIVLGDPMLVYANTEHAWRKVRCRSCAGEPVPEDLPALEERVQAVIRPTLKPSRLPRFAAVGELAADFKLKQAGDRDPGEDD